MSFSFDILVKYEDIFDKIYHYMLDIIIAVQFIKSQYTETKSTARTENATAEWKNNSQ